MSETNTLARENNEALPPAGDTPLGLYWGTPFIVALLIAGQLIIISTLKGPARVPAELVMWALALAAAWLQSARQTGWEREQHRRRIFALEAFLSVASAAGPEAQTELEILQKIPKALCENLGMTLSNVGLLEDDGKILHIVASDGVESDLTGQRLQVSDLPMTQACIHTKYLQYVTDSRHPTQPLNSELARKLHLRSMIHIPMVNRGQVLGIIVVGDKRVRPITHVDLRRAWLWGCQTAVMISNLRLYNRMSQALDEQTRLWQHRDALYAVNTEIQRQGTLDGVLQQIVNKAPGVLGADAALIWLLCEDNPNELIVGAISEPFRQTMTGFRIAVRGSKVEPVLNELRSLAIEDASKEGGWNPAMREKMCFSSMVFEPLLRGDGKPLGVLKLMRKAPGPFESDHLELIHLFSLRAAAAIEMAQLNEQIRRDADTKAILLRELNHRVKNNLASIASLLTINQPELPADAQQWLDRAIERIGAMAQMHEFFTGGPPHVTVSDVVEQTVRSLAVAKPANVTVRIELPAGDTQLRTDRAVSLALAIHELCFNGFVHALAAGGTLTIRSDRQNGDLRLEVCDDAGSAGPMAKANAKSHSGLGLELVSGLVGRELRGKFALNTVGAGAVATVQFPLLPDEIPESLNQGMRL